MPYPRENRSEFCATTAASQLWRLRPATLAAPRRPFPPHPPPPKPPTSLDTKNTATTSSPIVLRGGAAPVAILNVGASSGKVMMDRGGERESPRGATGGQTHNIAAAWDYRSLHWHLQLTHL
jgi:hypothetical protein